jgi:hypothetical protein
MEVQALLDLMTLCAAIAVIAGTVYIIILCFVRVLDLLGGSQAVPERPSAAPRSLWTSVEWRGPCQCAKPAREPGKAPKSKIDKSV